MFSCFWETELRMRLCTTKHMCIMVSVGSEETHKHFIQNKTTRTDTEMRAVHHNTDSHTDVAG